MTPKEFEKSNQLLFGCGRHRFAELYAKHENESLQNQYKALSKLYEMQEDEIKELKQLLEDSDPSNELDTKEILNWYVKKGKALNK